MLVDGELNVVALRQCFHNTLEVGSVHFQPGGAATTGHGFLSFGDDAFLKARRGETALTEVHRIVGGGEA